MAMRLAASSRAGNQAVCRLPYQCISLWRIKRSALRSARTGNMKYTTLAKSFLLAFSIGAPLVCMADVYVNGYTRKDGTHVQSHYRSSPDGVFTNNWSTLGNINPHTGELGTRTSPNYSSQYVDAPPPKSTSVETDDYGRYAGGEVDEELDQFYPYSDEP